MIKFLFMLVLVGILLILLVPLLLKMAVKSLIGKATQQQQQYSNPFGGNDSRTSSSNRQDIDEEYHGSVLVHDEDSARRMKRMKAEAEDVEAVIIDEPAKVREEEKVYR